MARQRRVEFPGAFYHVLARGNNRQVVFRDDQDYLVYVTRLKRYYKRYNFFLYAYTLMPNHIHLLIEISETPLSKTMQGIQQSYTSYFHRKYKSVGHLFQGRYKAILCQQEKYLLELVRYIHLNPIRASLVKNPDEYKWSSHYAYLDYLNQPFVSKNFVLKMFSFDEFTAKNLYRQFINEGLSQGQKREYYDIIDQRYLGSSEFVKKIEIKLRENTKNGESEKRLRIFQNRVAPEDKTVDNILKVVSDVTGISPECIIGRSKVRRISDVRALYSFFTSRYFGISNKSLAKFLNREDSSIANMIRKIEESIEGDQLLSEHLNKIMKVMKV